MSTPATTALAGPTAVAGAPAPRPPRALGFAGLPAFVIGLMVFCLAAPIIGVALHSQERQAYEVEFARTATEVATLVEAQAGITSQDLAQTRAFIAASDPDLEEWFEFVGDQAAAEGSWVGNLAIVERVKPGELGEALRTRPRLRRVGATLDPGTDHGLITHVTGPAGQEAVGLDVFAIRQARRLLIASAEGREPAVGVLPPALSTLVKAAGGGILADVALGEAASMIPVLESEDRQRWLLTDLNLRRDLTQLIGGREIAISVSFRSDVAWASQDAVDVHDFVDPEQSGSYERRGFSTTLLAGDIEVWGVGAPGVSSSLLVVAGAAGALVAFLFGFGAHLAFRAQRLRDELGRSERELHEDSLTGMRNRAGIMAELEERLDAGLSGGHLAVMVLDLDRFKVINDSLGHAVGDAVLRAVAGRLRSGIADGDALGRFGGDEFVIVAGPFEDPTEADLLAQRLLAGLEAPLGIDGRMLTTGASVGVALASGEPAPSADDLLRDADAAMYAAKDEGSGVRRFDAKLRELAVDRLLMEEALVSALAEGWLFLEYQPIVTGGGGRLIGVEALVRMRHPEFGVVPPGRFLPVAQETGRIDALGREVLRMACERARALNQAHPDSPPLPISVNLAESQAGDPGLVPYVRALLNENDLDGSQLRLELSEDALIEHVNRALPVLEGLDELGVQLSIDDFGTGRSSLAHLRLLSCISEVKIDRTFVAQLPDGATNEKIVRAIIDLADGVSARVVAEGVETREQRDRLVALGVGHLQGFLIARPGPPELISDWMSAPAGLIEEMPAGT